MSFSVFSSDLESDRNDPVTLHRVMRNMIGDGLKARYEPPKKLSHELFVLMLQLKEQEQRALKAKQQKEKHQRKIEAAASASL